MSEYNYPTDAMPPPRRLGLLPHDPAAVARAPSLSRHPLAAIVPRAVVDRSDVDFRPGLYQNDTLPCCTAAALANAASAVAILNGYQLAINPERVPVYYAECVGCAPTPAAMAATTGAVALEVLNRQAVHGFDAGMQTKLVGLHGVLPLSRNMIAAAVDRLGHAYLGVLLHERDMERAPVWDVQPGRGDGEVVGGHALVAWDYSGLDDSATVRLATWGELQPVTWRWLAARLTEAYAIVWRMLIGDDGLHLGVDAATLQAELAAMRSG